MSETKFYSGRAEYYDELFRVSPWKKFYHTETEALIEKFVPEKECSVLDAGGGTGLFSLPLAEKGHRVTVLDSSPDMIDILKEKVKSLGVGERVEIVLNDMGKIDGYSRNAFDITICTQVLNFLESSPGKIIPKLAHITKDKVVADVDTTYFWTMMEVLKGYPENALRIFRTGRDDVGRAVGGESYRTFDYNEIENILKNHDLKVYNIRALGNFVGFVHAISESKEFLEGSVEEGVKRYLRKDVYDKVVRLEEEARRNSELKDTAQWIQFVYGKDEE